MDIATYIPRWTAREGGAERANCQELLANLCADIEFDNCGTFTPEAKQLSAIGQREVGTGNTQVALRATPGKGEHSE